LESLEARQLLSAGPTEDVAAHAAVLPEYVNASQIEIYKDFNAWWGENKDEQTLQQLGYVKGASDGFGVRPTSELRAGLPANAKVVLITSNSMGWQSTADNVNAPAAQANLTAFVQNGGVLVMHLADNLEGDSFIAPGLQRVTTTGPINPIGDAAAASHPIILGPDQTAGTADDVTSAMIAQWSTHGYLPALPAGATTIVSRDGSPTLAEYRVGKGLVIVSSVTMEHSGTPDQLLTNELYYATHVRLNQAPAASAGGPYTVAEGGSVVLAGGGTDSDGSIVGYEWDLDGDGVFGETGAAAGRGAENVQNPTFSAAGLDGPSTYAVKFRVRDNTGEFSPVVSAVVNVQNAAPTVTPIAGDDSRVRGQDFNFSAQASDPGGAKDALEVSWDFGDGTVIGYHPATDSGALSVDHAYAAAGSYTVTLRVRDDDGGVTSVKKVVAVKVTESQPDPCDPTKTILVIGGTSGNDGIFVTLNSKCTGVNVWVGGVCSEWMPLRPTLLGTFAMPDGFMVFGYDGSDAIVIDPRITRKATVFGGAGNDLLLGGSGGDALVGGEGCDLLSGGGGRNLLVGGRGTDLLSGLEGDDILVAGSTDHDDNPGALCAILRQWERSDLSYAARVASIGAGVGPGGAYALNAATVHDDAAIDVVAGTAGRDWLIVNRTGVVDKILDGGGSYEGGDDKDKDKDKGRGKGKDDKDD
jgi:hypothetical protein